MKRIGIDLGTNSIGWAIVEYRNGYYDLLDKGVNIFKDGVEHGKSGESPMVQTRTEARGMRRHNFRRRLRKIELLKVLLDNDLCPAMSKETLDIWKSKKLYPMLETFIEWQRTDDKVDKNPYHDRMRCLTETLDLSNRADRYCLGRALYHLNQRRGFLSNRKEGSRESDGNVKKGIDDLTEKIKAADCTYIGEYFYKLYATHQKIRTTYTSRLKHVRFEFDAICEKQGLKTELIKDLEKAIFFQRPLKSQKGQVGECTFENGKKRCPASHPAFEEFRMLCFLNNVKVQTKMDSRLRTLSEDEFDKMKAKFYRKSKANFDFEDLAKSLVGKKEKYAYDKDAKNNRDADFLFNYRMDTNVSGCPVTSSLMEIFGEDWENGICSLYLQGDGKSKQEIVNDVWHALFSFDDDEKLKEWAMRNLQLTQSQADLFTKVKMPQDYASLSLNAINKMLPFLRRGFRYDQAVFLANLVCVLPKHVLNDEDAREQVYCEIVDVLSQYETDPTFRLKEGKIVSRQQLVIDMLRSKYGVDDQHIGKLYHPSMIEVYQDAKPNANGILQLGSPRTTSVKNPMAMRALFRLRHLINQLLVEGKIDADTIVNVEFARELNDANMRKAIQDLQTENKKEHDRIVKEIRTYGFEPTETDVLKFKLWEEQKHICIYTGKQIGVVDFLGDNPKFDIEHTIPRSLDGDDSQMNKTLCDSKFNREVKCGKIPYELANHAEILARIESMGWNDKISQLEGLINSRKRMTKTATTKAAKDKVIAERHFYKMKLDYYRGKLERFTIDRVNEGFTNRQGVNIGIIGKYARLYLKSLFSKVHVVKGATTADFRKMWGLQNEFEKKERVSHVHHCIDAITIACIGKREYDNWKQYTEDQEAYLWRKGQKPVFEKPWETFTEDVMAVSNEIFVHHFQPENMGKQTKKKVRVRGVVQYGQDGKPMYQQGASARGVLHMETFYGAIQREDDVKYVVRKSLASLEEKDVKNIVDDVVRKKVEDAIKEKTFKNAVSADNVIWMNEEKQIPIKKVRLFATKVTKPISLKKQRDLSDKTYKQDYHVSNDTNYCMAFYEGYDAKGKLKRDFEIVKNIDKARSCTLADSALLPSQKNGIDLKYILKTGQMVLFYDGVPGELKGMHINELSKRLYKIVGFSINPAGKGYGRASFKHHSEARPVGEIKESNGVWKPEEEYRPQIGLLHTQFNFLLEGVDFNLSITGEIKFKD